MIAFANCEAVLRSSRRLSVVKSYCGHGIGDLFHCAPNVPHYSPNKAVGVMKEGQTFTIEVCALVRLATCQSLPTGLHTSSY